MSSNSVKILASIFEADGHPLILTVFQYAQIQPRPMSHTSSFDSSIAEPDEEVEDFGYVGPVAAGMGPSGFNQNRISPAR